MKVILCQNTDQSAQLHPFTHIRPIGDLRLGLLTLKQTWSLISGWDVVYRDSDADPDRSPIEGGWTTIPLVRANPKDLSFPSKWKEDDVLRINASLMPDPGIWPYLLALDPGEAYHFDGYQLAYRPSREATIIHARELPPPFHFLRYPWQLIQWNDTYLRKIFPILTAGRASQPIDPSNTVIGGPIFLEEGAKVTCSVLNAATGPIYIGRNAEVMEGCLIRGPLALDEGAVLKMGTKSYGPVSLGPYCTGGGELKNVILLGYSNKGHDGYLGDSLIGEWCNLGAGTTNSNLRNNATEVRVFNPALGEGVAAGIKMGLLMGDYSRTAIQTAFHTGAVVGICCNVFGGTPVSGYLPNFSWGLTGQKYDWEKALRDIDNWKKLKGHALTPEEIQKLGPIFGA